MAAVELRKRLDEELRRLHPSVRLLPRRWLRRIIRRHRGMGVSGGPAPHENVYALSRADLVAVVDPLEAELGDEARLPERLVLIAEPSDAEILERPASWWKRIEEALFHDAIDDRFEQRVPTMQDAVNVGDLVSAAQRREIRKVLEEHNRLFPGYTERDTAREAVALFLELVHFEPERLADFFPGLTDVAGLRDALEQKLDAKELAEGVRLASTAELAGVFNGIQDKAVEALKNRPADAKVVGSLVSFAETADRQDNDIRAMLVYQRLGQDAKLAHVLEQFAKRLGTALADESNWLPLLEKLPALAAGDGVSRAGRLLFDLQKICVDIERPIYAVELMECVITLGRKPIKRRIDKVRDVRVLRHLRSAGRHAEILNDEDASLHPLVDALVDAQHDAEHRIRHELRPILVEALDEVELKADDRTGDVARAKMVEEMLDGIVERGFLRMGDVRDAIARNRLKMPDLSGAAELWSGDPLIRLNRILPYKLDGIYQRGEIYLRGFQRFSSLFFGTIKGRWFTKYVALPFGGSFVFLEGLQHFVEAIEGLGRFLIGNPKVEHVVDGAMKHVYGLLGTRETMGHAGRYVPQEATWATLPAVLLLGVLFLLLIHSPPVRSAVLNALKLVFHTVPKRIIASPVTQAVLYNPVTHFLRKFVLVPALVGGAFALALRLLGAPPVAALAFWALIALANAVFFRTRAGREVEERMDEALDALWRAISVNFLLGVLEWIFFFFKTVMDYIERGIYAVDEWLRFREGENKIVYLLKLAAGTVWWFFTYIFRFCWNLLIEPQINPIKHFPVVTVSHKLLLPMVPALADAFGSNIPTVTTVVSTIPGIFGFLAWELKENWKLYRANASKTVDPVVVGSHGEKVRRLLRPGFHSGTIPKTFAKLRVSRTPGRIRKQRHALHHIEESLERFADRQCVVYLAGSKRWGALPAPIADWQLATNRLTLMFHLEGHSDEVELCIEERDGWLLAGLPNLGWLKAIPAPAQNAFLDALTGLLHLAGVNVLKEHSAWATGCLPDEIDAWGEFAGIRYPDGALRPMPAEAKFDSKNLMWSDWKRQWQRDAAGENPPPIGLEMRMVG